MDFPHDGAGSFGGASNTSIHRVLKMTCMSLGLSECLDGTFLAYYGTRLGLIIKSCLRKRQLRISPQ